MDEYLDDADLQSLEARLESLLGRNSALRKENAAFEAYLRRHVSAEDADEWAFEGNSRSRGSRRAKAATITLEQKLEVAVAELNTAKKETLLLRIDAAKSIEKLKSMLQQTDVRIADLKTEAFEFKKNVVQAGEHHLTGAIMAERVVKYYEDSFRHKDARIDRLRLSVAALVAASRKDAASAATTASLASSPEGGADGPSGKATGSDVLAYIDFHQLQIENKQSSAKMEERNAELMRMKVTTGSAVTLLNGLKSRLSASTRDTGRLRSDIRTRAGVVEKLRAENAGVSRDVEGARDTRAALADTAALGGHHLPTTIDYIALAAMEKDLLAEVASWRRKLEIVSLGAGTMASRLRLGSTGGVGGQGALDANEGELAAVAQQQKHSFGRTNDLAAAGVVTTALAVALPRSRAAAVASGHTPQAAGQAAVFAPAPRKRRPVHVASRSVPGVGGFQGMVTIEASSAAPGRTGGPAPGERRSGRLIIGSTVRQQQQ